MSIIYICTLIVLISLAILVKKSEEKIEIVKTLIVIGITLIPYNTFVCYILNLVNIPITLLSLTIVNVIIGLALVIKIIRDKEIQKYTVSKLSLLVVLIFIIITTTVISLNFENLSKIRYVSMDAREHYKAAREFSENTSLSNKAQENNTVTATFMPGAYTNAGILFKIFEPYIGTVQLYNMYILFEAFIYTLSGIMFYMLIEKYTKKTTSKVIAIIFSIVYILGYPLNAWISGFHYLLVGILCIEAIIYVVMQLGKIKLGYELIIIFLLNFGLILSYALFCPFVYLTEFIYFVYKYIKDKDKIKLFLLVLLTLILPGIIGLTYLIIPSLGKVGGYIALEGWVYKNLWSNFIFFIPFTLYAIYKSIKNKEFTFDNILFTLLVMYMIVLFVGTKLEICSEYYFYKNYYIMWLMLIYFNIKGMNSFIEQEKEKIVIGIYTSVYMLVFIVSICFQKVYIMHETNDSISATMEIFVFNKTMMCEKGAEFIKKDEIDLLIQMENVLHGNWKQEDNILFVTGGTQERWIQSLTGFINVLYDDKEYAINNLKEENYKYIVTFENRNAYQNMKEYINEENMKIVYENSIGKIYEKIQEESN